MNIDKQKLYFKGISKQLSLLIGIGGLVLLAIAYFIGNTVGDELQLFAYAYLTSYYYFLSITLGALFFVILQHLTHSRWSPVIRRLAEMSSANLILMAVLFLPIILKFPTYYAWVSSEAVHEGTAKAAGWYMGTTFLLLRCVVYFGCWLFIMRFYRSRSSRQDESGDVELTRRMERFSGPAMVIFAFTITFASFDFFMALGGHWYSTIFGVYFFSGCAVGFFAWLIVVILFLQRTGRLTEIVTVEHFHDIGKYFFGFVFFWGYIAFCQYMLMWYANIPEETRWFLNRQTGSWALVSVVLLLCHFFLPFLGLLSKTAKRSRLAMVFWALWMLAMHWVDIFYLVRPEFMPGQARLTVIDALCFLGFSCLFIAVLSRVAASRALVPVKDPRLQLSLNFRSSP